MLYSFLKFLHIVFPAQEVYAHCDIPCGIYTPEPALTAAKTVLKMVEKILDQPPADHSNAASLRMYQNSITRFVTVKEEHAQLCKKELLILWTDYFKAEDLAMFPDLHEKFWKAAKFCSANKREVDRKAAQDLLNAVQEIASIFLQTEESRKAKV